MTAYIVIGVLWTLLFSTVGAYYCRGDSSTVIALASIILGALWPLTCLILLLMALIMMVRKL